MLVAPTLLAVVGIGCLTLGADRLVRGAANLAARMGVSPLVIGLTVVALGTSLPETAVSIGSATRGEGDVALGNVIGSNIFNILVVLGGAALIRPMLVSRPLVRMDLPVMVGSALLVLLLALDGAVSRADGLLLVVLAAVYTVALFRAGSEPPSPERAARPRPSRRRAMVELVVGAILLVLGARLLVDGATELARALGVSELVIGLTVVAIGTSLPEVATSFVAAIQGERDMAVGNVVGSNIFNALVVLGAAGIVAPAPIAVASGALTFDLPIMVGASLACLPIFLTGWCISRGEGALFIAYYVAYLIYLGLHLADHPVQAAVRDGILFYAAPITALTLGLMAMRELRRPGRGDPSDPARAEAEPGPPPGAR